MRKKLQTLFESMAQTLPPGFYRDLMSAARKSGTTPEEVMVSAVELYKTTLLQPDNKERLRAFAARYHALVGTETAENMTPEQRSQRSSLGGHASAASMTAAQRRLRAQTAAEARYRKSHEARALTGTNKNSE